MEGFVDYNDLKNLGLTPGEQNALTKLSLSKIVSKCKQEVDDEKKKNYNVSLLYW